RGSLRSQGSGGSRSRSTNASRLACGRVRAVRGGGAVKVLSVVGARPQFVKLAPVAAALTAAGATHVIVHTGQHYDARMSDVFFADLSIPDPTVHLGVGSAGHGVQTGAMLGAMDAVLDEHQPDWV